MNHPVQAWTRRGAKKRDSLVPALFLSSLVILEPSLHLTPPSLTRTASSRRRPSEARRCPVRTCGFPRSVNQNRQDSLSTAGFPGQPSLDAERAPLLFMTRTNGHFPSMDLLRTCVSRPTEKMRWPATSRSWVVELDGARAPSSVGFPGWRTASRRLSQAHALAAVLYSSLFCCFSAAAGNTERSFTDRPRQNKILF